MYIICFEYFVINVVYQLDTHQFISMPPDNGNEKDTTPKNFGKYILRRLCPLKMLFECVIFFNLKFGLIQYLLYNFV